MSGDSHERSQANLQTERGTMPSTPTQRANSAGRVAPVYVPKPFTQYVINTNSARKSLNTFETPKEGPGGPIKSKPPVPNTKPTFVNPKLNNPINRDDFNQSESSSSLTNRKHNLQQPSSDNMQNVVNINTMQVNM
jgi:hypothetical protein